MRVHAILIKAAVIACATLMAPLAAYGIQVGNPADVPIPGSQPSTQPGDVALTAEIRAVKGNVAVQPNENADWQPAVVGMKIEQGAVIRTGLKSVVQFLIGSDELITLDRISTITLLQAVQNQGKARTDLGLKYGRVRYDIQKADLQHDSKVRSPGSTLAIRGTDVTYEDQAPWVPTAISREGRAEFRNFRRQFVGFGGKRRASVASDKEGPAQQALSNTRADPRGKFAGRTTAEEELNLTIQSLGGADAAVQRAAQEVLRGFALGPEASAIGIINGQGPLEFTLEWLGTGRESLPSNIDLIVTDPKGQVLSAINPIVGSGVEIGQHFGDDPGTTGIGGERAAWGEFFPPGQFTLRATHQGGDAAQVTLTAFQGDGEQLIQTVLTPTDPTQPLVLNQGESFTATLTPPKTPSNAKASAAAQRAAARQTAKVQKQQEQQQRQAAAAAKKPAKAPRALKVGKGR